MPTSQTPGTLDDALVQITPPRHQPMGAGIDLRELVATGTIAVDVLVELADLDALVGVATLPDGGLRIGGATPLSVVLADPRIRAGYPLLASACAESGPAEVVERATIAGNLAQRPRCRYFRQRVPCFKHGGDRCPARSGDNRLLAIVEGGPCFVVQRSDVATALVALDAMIEVASARGTRTVTAADFFVLPAVRLDRETVLADDEVIAAVRLPVDAAGGVQRFTKVRDDGWGFALASLAAVRRADGDVRLVLGGVSPRPYRIYNSIEEETTSGGLDEDTIEGLAERALLDAEPLSENAYKIELAATLLRDAIRELSRDP